MLTAVENIFHIDEVLGHEIVFLYTGRLNPLPVETGATLTESDGSVVPIAWRSVHDHDDALPLYPTGTQDWVSAAVTRRRP